jgi:phosphate:Na+ symporter
MSDVGTAAWAGLGLFFVGLRMVSSHMRQFAGGALRSFLTRALHRPMAPHSAGLMFGALTQSTGAVTFITSGLIASGAMTMQRALPMLAWANLGTSALVLLAAINIESGVLVLLGLVGVAFFLGAEQAEKYRHITFALLGLGLLMFGLTMLKTSVASIGSDPWMREFVEFAGSGVAIALVSGFVIAVAVQSSSIVTVLALPLVHEGLISLDQTVLMIYGASVGSGFAVMLAASGMEGASRQISMVQAMLRAAAAAVLLPLFFVERDTGVPMVLALLRLVTDSDAAQCALAYALFQVVLVVFSEVMGKPLISLAARLAPPSPEETIMKPHYLFDEAVSDPDTALALVDLEHKRLLTFLPDFIEDLRPVEERSTTAHPLKLRFAASDAIASEIDQFLAATLRANPGMSGVDKVFSARTRLQTLQPLQVALRQFASDLIVVPVDERPAFAEHMVEGLHAILMVAAEAASDESGYAQDMLYILTEERSALMERVREELLGGSANIAGREALLSATLTFERIIWLLRRLSPPPANPAQASGDSAAGTPLEDESLIAA